MADNGTAGSAVPTALTTIPTATMPALTGDVTSSAGTVATSITGLALSKLATQAAGTVLLNATAGAAVPTAGDYSVAIPVLDLDFNAWFAKQVAFAKSLSASLTGFRPIRPNGLIYSALNGTSIFSQDPHLEGGGTGTTSNGQHWFESGSQLQHPKTGTYVIAFRAQFSAQSGTVDVSIGIGDGATGEISIHSKSTYSATHWELFAGGTGQATGTVALDTNWHDFVIFNNGTTIKTYVDQVQDTSIAASLASADAAYGAFNNSGTAASAQVNVAAILIGYVSTSGI